MLEIKPEEIRKIVNSAKPFALFNRGVQEILYGMRETACQKVEGDDRVTGTLSAYAKRESTRVGPTQALAFHPALMPYFFKPPTST
jgi:hypothetical protein